MAVYSYAGETFGLVRTLLEAWPKIPIPCHGDAAIAERVARSLQCNFSDFGGSYKPFTRLDASFEQIVAY
jgi:hypothetical protein